MTDYRKQAEEIISESIQFVYRDDDPAKLAVMINIVKQKHPNEIEYIAEGLKDNIPAFIFRSMFTHQLFESRILEYSMGIDHNPHLDN